MKKKFKSLLSDKVKDMGLSDKAIEELVETGTIGLAEDATDQDIETKVNSVVPFAKLMQAEYTRKVQEVKQSQQQPSKGGNGGEGGDGNDVKTLIENMQKSFETRIASLEGENNALKAAKNKEARDAKISAKAKELGIPDFLMKRFSVPEDADFEKELTEYKQELVNNKLVPAQAAGEQGTSEQAMVDAAKAWAENLPNK